MGKSNIGITEYMSTNEYSKTNMPAEVKDWIVKIDKFLVDTGCRAETYTWGMGIGGRFPYISRKSQKPVCIIYINPDGCSIAIGGNHFLFPNETSVNSILGELPENILPDVRKRIENYDSHNPRFDFELNEKVEFEILKKWIEYETAWKPEKKSIKPTTAE